MFALAKALDLSLEELFKGFLARHLGSSCNHPAKYARFIQMREAIFSGFLNQRASRDGKHRFRLQESLRIERSPMRAEQHDLAAGSASRICFAWLDCGRPSFGPAN